MLKKIFKNFINVLTYWPIIFFLPIIIIGLFFYLLNVLDEKMN